MKHGRPDRAWVQLTAERYSGTHAGAWVGDLMMWRRQHAQCVWQAMQAIAWGAVAFECGRYQPHEWSAASGWNEASPWNVSWDGK